MKLSICLMVKDEEKNLERCLNSLKSLREKTDSELIIVDTGSTDRTVEIAKKFTDKLYFHPWNNNFSEMRNITHSYAQGQWIFVIDADEEVEDAADLVKFMNGSDKNKKAGAYSVRVGNIMQENDTSPQNEFVSPRIFRNNKSFKYEGVVHNLPVYSGDLLHLNLTLLHYGYMATDKELMEKKFQRTKTLLEQELAKDPQNIYFWFQLSATYSMHKENREALIPAIKAYNLIKQKELDPKPYIYLYGHIVNLYLDSENYNLQKAEQFCIEGLELEPEHLDLHLYLAQIREINNDADSAIMHYQEYLYLAEHFQELKVSKNKLIMFYLVDRYTESALKLSELYCNLERYDQAATLLAKLNLSKLSDQKHMLTFVKSFMNTGEFQKLKTLYMSQEAEDKVSWQISMDNNYKSLNPILKRNFLSAFSNDYENDTYFKLQKLRFLFLESKDSEIHAVLMEFADTYDFNFGLDIYGEILYYFFKLFIPIEKIFSKITEMNILEYLKYLSRNYQDFNIIIRQYTKTMETSNSIAELRTFKILNRFVLDVLETQNDFDKIFFNYLYFGLNYIQRIYRDEIFKLEITVALKSNEDSFLLYLSKALDIHDKDQRSSYLEKALSIYPQMHRGVELLLDDKFLIWTQEKELKAQINILMGLQEYDSINQVIEEYKLICGNVLDADFYSIQGAAYIYLNQLEKANEVLLEGLSIDPSNVDILFNLGYLKGLVGNFNKAIYYYIQAKGNCLNPEIKLQIEQQLAEIDKMMIQYENGRSSITLESTEAVRSYAMLKLLGKDEQAIFPAGFILPQPGFRVLQGTIEIANQMNTLTTALNKQGVSARAVNYYKSYLGYNSDQDVFFEDCRTEEDMIFKRKMFTAEVISEYDIFHFHFGTSLTFDHSDVPLLKLLGKKAVMHYWGSDVRRLSIVRQYNPYGLVKNEDELQILRNLEYIASHIDECIVSDYELYPHVQGYFRKIHFLPQALDLTAYQPMDQMQNKRPLFVHAPTSPITKGTKYILKAIENLKQEYDFDFKLIQGVSHSQAKAEYQKADLIIDQILGMGYGMLAVEAMAMGKPVVCWINDYMKEHYPKGLPVISANPDTITHVLRYVLNNREMLPILGKRGREYAMMYHDANRVAEKLVSIYQTL